MKESEIYFKFLLAIIAADGVITLEEEEYITSSMESAGIDSKISSEIISNINHVKSGGSYILPDGFSDIVRSTGNPNLLVNMIKDGFEIALTDGDIADSEEQVLQQLSNSLTSDTGTTFDQVRDWALKSIELESAGIQLFSN
jgi:uncharacterized tellurite resistance protein B-like protein